VGPADPGGRVRAGLILPPRERLAYGSYLSRLRKRVHGHYRDADAVVRVIDYGIGVPGRLQAEPRYRLLTTMLDPGAAPLGHCPTLPRWRAEAT
jgi:hypothetical protein